MKVKAKTLSMVVIAAISFVAMARQKKLVSCAWEWARTGPGELLELQPQIAASGYDGVLVSLRFPHGDVFHSSGGLCNESWNWEEMQGELAKFKAVLGKPGLTDCFLETFRCPSKRLAWTDDSGWARIGENMRLASRFAREAGAVGIVIDHEDYPLQRQFERLPIDLPMAELAPLVRRRGREVFGSVFKEFPDVKLLFFWFMTDPFTHANINGVRKPLEALADFGKLWAFFANGIMDVMSPASVIIDGNENSYKYQSGRFEYFQQSHATRDLDGFCVPENLTKYHNQVQSGGALYLDMYVQTNAASQWYKGPSSGTRLGMMRRDLAQLLDASDEYAWTWSEWNPIVKRVRRPNDKWERFPDPIWWNPIYEEKMPGFSKAIKAIKNPVKFMEEDVPALLAGGTLTNLVQRGFVATGSWQEDMKGRSFGTFTNDLEITASGRGSVRMTGISKGCVVVAHSPVAPGEIYLVRAKAKVAAGGFSSCVAWGQDNKLRFFLPETRLSFAEADQSGWRQGMAVAVVPEGADTLRLVLSVAQDAGETCWADGAEIYRIQ